MADSNRSDPVAIGPSMTPVFTYLVPDGAMHGKMMITASNTGTGAVTEFLIEGQAANYPDCPWMSYLGTTDCEVDVNGNLTCSNIQFLSPGWPTIAALGTGCIVFDHQFFYSLRISFASSSGAAIVQTWTRG